MADSKTLAAASNPKPIKTLLTSLIFQLKIWLLPILLAVVVLLFQVNTFDPAPFPVHEFTNQRAAPITAPETNSRILWKSEFIGSRQLLGPEDIAYEPKSGIIYTGCVDGWIKRVKLGDSVSESVVEDWVNTGGRPLGIAIAIAIASSGVELIVADALKV